MRLDHLLSRENTRSAEARRETSKVEHLKEFGCKEKGREAKAEKPKTLAVAESNRCIVLKDRREKSSKKSFSGRDLQRTLKTAQGKSRGKTEVNSILKNTVVITPSMVFRMRCDDGKIKRTRAQGECQGTDCRRRTR